MGQTIPFSVTEYGDGSNPEAVALVAGLAGNVEDLEQAALDLYDNGRDSIIYTYDPGVLLEGDPTLLPDLVDALTNDFSTRVTPQKRRFGGVSLGGAIAAGMQKRAIHPETGLYAASGTNAAELIMHNMAFNAIIRLTHHLDIRKAYTRNGHDTASLNHAWREFHTPPSTPFTIAMGGLDIVTRRRTILKNINKWRQSNPDITVIDVPYRGHSGTIDWYNNNIDTMLAASHRNQHTQTVIDTKE